MRYILSRIMLAEAALMVIPLAVTLIYREWADIWAFIIPIGALVLAGMLISIKAPKDGALFARDGLAIVALSWIIMSAFGALPLLISRAVPTYIDAFFETVSGFTTTGASVVDPAKLADVASGTPAAIGCGVLFWRSFTHWIGGMGVLVFVMAILPISGSRSMHIMRAEVPGPEVGKLVTKMSKTAKILYGIYLGITLLEVIFLICGGMTPYDALIHAFGTAGTGGFSNQAASVGAYNSLYIDVVVSVFMLIFGVNFNIYYFILIKQVKKAVRNLELRVYLVIVAISTGVVAANIIHIYRNFGTSLRYAFFHVSSLITTTGFCTGGDAVNFNEWPTLSKC
ncbi:MAG: TrkH family potassium uptake protein, partial [Firmicutes bacterium]|nr:TrkH family potassium uptake protein [Bacillota bacterium]